MQGREWVNKHFPFCVFTFFIRTCSYSTKVLETKPKRSPLTRGGLEIKCRVCATWINEEKLQKLKILIIKNYDIDTSLKDDSASILKSLKIDIEPDNESEDETESSIAMDADDS